MTKDEALTLALEALERLALPKNADDIFRRATVAIKEALAQPERDPWRAAAAQPEQKPVAWEQFHEYLLERNFCPRCGKRLASGFVEISIHTCTPPKENA